MNFVKYSKELKSLLDRKSGLYLFSREQVDQTFKMGMSENGLYKRLTQHKSCYPYISEYWLQFIILTDLPNTRPLEKSFLNETKHLKTITVEESKTEQAARPREYRIFSTRTHMNKTVRNLLNNKDNKLLWSHCIVFSENSWHIIKNISLTRSVSLPVDNINVLAQKSARLTSREPIEQVKALPYDKSEVLIKRILKKVSKIKTKWGQATVVRVLSQEKVICKWPNYDGAYELKITTV